MSILVMCSNPDCGELFDVPDDAAGTEVQCPACGSTEAVPLAVDKPKSTEAEAPSSGTSSKQPPATVSDNSSDPLDLSPAEAPSSVAGGESSDSSVAAEASLELTPLEPGALSQQWTAEPPESPTETAETDETPRPSETPVNLSSVFDEEEQEDTDPWEDTALAEMGLIETAPPPDSSVEGALQNKWVFATLLLVGLLGMVAGIFIGATCFPSYPIMAGFVGGCVGWVAFFILSFLLVLANEREELNKAHCPVCGHRFPVGTELCQLCGSPLLGPDYNPLTSAFLDAGGYALSNKSAVCCLATLLVVGHLLFGLSGYLLGTVPDVPQWLSPTRLVASIGLGFLIFGAWMEFLLTAIRQTLDSSDDAPKTPMFGHPQTILSGLKGLAVLAVYLAPMVTIPLCPLGFLLISGRGKFNAYHPVQVGRAMWAHTRDFVILWLWLLLWVSAAVFGIVIVMGVFQLIEMLIPQMESTSMTFVLLFLQAIRTGFIAAIICLGALATFRCIGMFGRKNAATLVASAPKSKPVEASGGAG